VGRAHSFSQGRVVSYSVLGAPASLIGSELPRHQGSGLYTALGRAFRLLPFARPSLWRPLRVAQGRRWCDHETIEALVGFCSPILLRPGFFLCTLDYAPAKPVHKKHNTRRYEHPLAGGPGRSGRGCAELRIDGVLRSSCVKPRTRTPSIVANAPSS
jgi:hypothetical protein